MKACKVIVCIICQVRSTLDEIADIKTAVSEAVTILLYMGMMKMSQSLYI